MADAEPMPAIAPAVNVAVAVPLLWMVAWAPEILPRVALKVTDRPITRGRLLGETALPAESVRKSAVTVVDAPGSKLVEPAPMWSCRALSSSLETLPPLEFPSPLTGLVYVKLVVVTEATTKLPL